MKDIVYRLLAAGVGLGAAKLAEKGVTLSAEVQVAVVVGAYGMAHRLLDFVGKKFGKK